MQTVMFISIVCTLMFSLSRKASDALLGFLKCLVNATLRRAGVKGDPVVDLLFESSKSVRSRYRLDGKTTVYAVCPECHTTYAPINQVDQVVTMYPKICTNVIGFKGKQCGEVITKTTLIGGRPFEKPIKPFVYHSLLDFISGMTSQHSLETALDKACDDLRGSREDKSTSKPCRGPFEADYLKTFPGPRPNELFIERGDELRLAFSLNVDFFNIEGVRASGASTSCGIISMVCLNLPENIRYKSENIYLAGIIPGPREPKLTALNHYLRPLMDDLVVLWSPGFRLSRTASAKFGRTVRGALVIVICDLPAARKTAGLLGHGSSKFMCSVCHCTNDKIGDIETNFPKRDPQVLRREAERWRLAKSEADRTEIEKKYGTRWSELWRLSYWDPTRQLVVDSMHCLLEGLVHNHFRHVLRFTSEAANTKTAMIPAYYYKFEQVPSKEDDPTHPVHTKGDERYMKDSKQVKQVSRIHSMLREPLCSDATDVDEARTKLAAELQKMHKAPLVFVWSSLKLNMDGVTQTHHIPTKENYAFALAKWVCEFALVVGHILMLSYQRFDTKALRSKVVQIRLATPQLINYIRNVILHTVKPTWINPVPYNFGDASAGSIKADEWRTLSTIYLPIALVTFWEYVSKPKDDADRQRLQKVLDNTMELVQAVTVLFKRSTTEANAAMYNFHIKKYVHDLVEVHPQVDYVPNMHMAKHLSDNLRQFGSVYSWWTFPFERLIGLLQDLPRNFKAGTPMYLSSML